MHYTVIQGDDELSYFVEPSDDGTYRFTIEGGGPPVEADIRFLADGRVHVLVGGKSYDLSVELDNHKTRCAVAGRVFEFDIYNDRDLRLLQAEASHVTFDPDIRSPMAGKIIDVPVSIGDYIEAGSPLVVVEAMKMENQITAPHDGTVKSISVGAGDAVESGALLLVLTPDEDEAEA